jgi:hypothetical protein
MCFIFWSAVFWNKDEIITVFQMHNNKHFFSWRNYELYVCFLVLSETLSGETVSKDLYNNCKYK